MKTFSKYGSWKEKYFYANWEIKKEMLSKMGTVSSDMLH